MHRTQANSLGGIYRVDLTRALPSQSPASVHRYKKIIIVSHRLVDGNGTVEVQREVAGDLERFATVLGQA
jgi:hypothetical protein